MASLPASIVHASSQRKHELRESADSIVNAINCTDCQNITEFTINASNGRHQSPKITQFQPKLKISKSEPNWLSITYK